MGKELLRGVAWGVIVIGLMLTVASLIAPQPIPRDVVAAVEGARVVPKAGSDGARTPRKAAPAVEGGDAPAGSPEAPDVAGAGAMPDQPAAPDADADAAVVSVAPAPEVTPAPDRPEVASPDPAVAAPGAPAMAEVAALPDQPAAPETDETASVAVAPAPEATPLPEAPTGAPLDAEVVAPGAPVGTEVAALPDQPATPGADETASIAVAPAPEATPLPEAPESAAPDAEAAVPVAPPEAEVAALPDQPAVPDAAEAPALAGEPAAPVAGEAPAGPVLAVETPDLPPPPHGPEVLQLTSAAAELPTAPPVGAPPVVGPETAPVVAQPGADLPQVPEADATILAEAAPDDTPVPVAPLLSQPGPGAAVPEVAEFAPAELPPRPGDVPAGGPDAVILAETAPAPPVVPAPGAAAEPAPQPRIISPGGDGGSRLPGKRVGRLPTIGTAPETPEPAPEAEVAAAPARAVEKYARSYAGAGGRPMISIVLIDTGEGLPNPESLAAIPFPIAFAIDASRPDAAERMALFRAVGQEVVAIAPLPAGAQASDAAVALEGYLAAVPEAVAVIEAVPGGLQADRGVAEQVVAGLVPGGQGLLAWKEGFDRAAKAAEAAGVPEATVFRVIDGEGRDMAAIRRFVDQAAFKAGQIGSVVLVGHAEQETLVAVADWMSSARAATVSVAPVSALLIAGR